MKSSSDILKDISVFNSSGISFLPIKKAKEIADIVLSKKNTESGAKYDSIKLNVVYLSDKEIHQINKEFLEHDYPTDVITFTLEDTGTELEGEIYISADTAKEQAKDYSVSLRKEVLRLVTHGCLHLMGMDDATEVEKDKMTQEEDRFLKMYNCL